jgi:ADP-heptose:LPS heptosyltransferase
VRDLHACYPTRFVTDARTSCAELWEHNPYLTPLSETDPTTESIDCHYPLIHRCQQTPAHFLFGYIEFLNETLDLAIRPTACRGDIHIAPHEKGWFSQIHELTGEDTPFWIVGAGGKFDMTIKWWSTERYQAVVDHFRDRLLFVQVGEGQHHHPPLTGVIDLRGRTDLRQLVRLVYHASGVLCGVTSLMHLAAAIERKDTGTYDRPCVVVAGGREPPHWEAYSHHQFVHTVGMLPCSIHGCWRSRTRALGDGDERDEPRHLCVDPVGDLPHCMDLITPDDIIRRIAMYLDANPASVLSRRQRLRARPWLVPASNGSSRGPRRAG